MEKCGQLYALATLPSGKNPHTLWIRGWVVPQPVWTFQRRKKLHMSTGIQNPYLAACSIVTIAHSFTRTGQWTKTSNQHTLQSCMYNVLYIVCCNANGPGWYMGLFSIESCLFCGLYLQLTPILSNITVISFTYQKVDKGTFVKRTYIM